MIRPALVHAFTTIKLLIVMSNNDLLRGVTAAPVVLKTLSGSSDITGIEKISKASAASYGQIERLSNQYLIGDVFLSLVRALK